MWSGVDFSTEAVVPIGATGTPPLSDIGASHLPRAASVGYRPEESVILVSRGLVDRLDGRELDAALAHELAHLLNRDAAVMTLLAFPQSKIGKLLSDDLADRIEYAVVLLIPVFVVAIPVYITNRLAARMVARYREYVADHAAGELVGSHAAVAGALTTLDQEYSTQYTQDLRVGWSTRAFGIVPPPWEERKCSTGRSGFFTAACSGPTRRPSRVSSVCAHVTGESTRPVT
jgi:Zn-dependent protease with chaperone function